MAVSSRREWLQRDLLGQRVLYGAGPVAENAVGG